MYSVHADNNHSFIQFNPSIARSLKFIQKLGPRQHNLWIKVLMMQLRKKLSIKEENYSEESSRKDSGKEW